MRNSHHDNIETTYLVCPKCGTEHQLEVSIMRGFASHADFVCQACDFVLGEYRADNVLKFRMVKLGSRVARAS